MPGLNAFTLISRAQKEQSLRNMLGGPFMRVAGWLGEVPGETLRA